MEIAAGLHRIETLVGNRHLYQHLYIGERILLVDTGTTDTLETHVFPYLESLGRDPSEIDMAVITHADADHFGGNESLKRVAGKAWIACHAFDAEWISDPDEIMEGRYNQFSSDHGMRYPVDVRQYLRGMMGKAIPIDITLTGGETIHIDGSRSLNVLFLPGHPKGHIGLYDPSERLAVLTDAVLSFGRGSPMWTGGW